MTCFLDKCTPDTSTREITKKHESVLPLFYKPPAHAAQPTYRASPQSQYHQIRSRALKGLSPVSTHFYLFASIFLFFLLSRSMPLLFFFQVVQLSSCFSSSDLSFRSHFHLYRCLAYATYTSLFRLHTTGYQTYNGQWLNFSLTKHSISSKPSPVSTFFVNSGRSMVWIPWLPDSFSYFLSHVHT